MTLKEEIKQAREKASDAAYDLSRQQRDGEAVDELEATIKDLRAEIRDQEMHDTWASAEIAEINAALSIIVDAVEALDTRISDIENK